MYEANVLSNNRITIPKKMRNYLGLQAGDKVIFIKRAYDTIIRKK